MQKCISFLVLPVPIEKKQNSKVRYFNKMAEIRTALAAKTALKAESCTTKSLLMQDWVFRLGSDLYLFIQELLMDSTTHLSIKDVIDSRIDSVLNCVVPKNFTDQ